MTRARRECWSRRQPGLAVPRHDLAPGLQAAGSGSGRFGRLVTCWCGQLLLCEPVFGHPVPVQADGRVFVTAVSCLHAQGPEPCVDGAIAGRKMIAGFEVGLDVACPRGPVQQLASDRVGIEPASDAPSFERSVAQFLRSSPELIAMWATWSGDQRWTPSAYLEGIEVGWFDGACRDVKVHPDTASGGLHPSSPRRQSGTRPLTGIMPI
jgi:hypothetical protein